MRAVIERGSSLIYSEKASATAEAEVAFSLLSRSANGGAGSAVTLEIDSAGETSLALAAANDSSAFGVSAAVASREGRAQAQSRRQASSEGKEQTWASLNPSKYTMTNVTIVDSNSVPRSQEERVSVVSSWVLVHVMGNHTSALKEPELSKLVLSMRDAVADSLEVCRPCVGIVDIRAINIDLVEPDPPRRRLTHVSLVQHWQRMMRNDEQFISHVNVTQIKAVYEVRIFDQMRYSDNDVARRIDRFQIYGKFSELARLLVRSFARNDKGGMEGVVLDDVGYASRHMLWRPPILAADMQDCVEEVMLHDTRQVHQYVVALSLVLVAFITCAGSAVFTIKHPSIVPSRLNPLVSNS